MGLGLRQERALAGWLALARAALKLRVGLTSRLHTHTHTHARAHTHMTLEGGAEAEGAPDESSACAHPTVQGIGEVEGGTVKSQMYLCDRERTHKHMSKSTVTVHARTQSGKDHTGECYARKLGSRGEGGGGG